MAKEPGHIRVEDAKTLDGLFRERTARSSGRVSHVGFSLNMGVWQPRTWGEMYAAIGRWQAGFAADNLKPGDRVALMLRNCPDWVMFDQAAYAEGLVVVPLYAADRAENAAYILADCGAKLVLFDTQEQWDEFRARKLDLPGVQRILVLNPSGKAYGDARAKGVTGWLPASGKNRHVSDDGKRLASIIYTSGTTGRPKGVMLSHLNMLTNCRDALAMSNLTEKDELLSFLPLSHIFERTVGYYMSVMAGCKTTYARSVPSLAEDLLRVRPTMLNGVPRVYERLWSEVSARLARVSRAKRGIFKFTVGLGWRRFEYKQGRGKWKAAFLLWPILKWLVGKRLLSRLGGRLRVAGSGGAALAPDIMQSFITLGVTVIQGYGMTEASPVITTNSEDDNVLGSVGKPIPNVEIRVANDGELLVKGPNVMMGYWNNPKATALVLRNGWLHTGDLARIDPGGHVFLTGRIKDILVLANGEKVQPEDIETAILGDGMFDHVMLVGEGKPYLAALAVVNRDRWTEAARAARVEPNAVSSPAAEQLALARIAERMRPFPGHAQVRRIALSFEPWSVENGLLTPTLKPKRAQILKQHAADFARLYDGN